MPEINLPTYGQVEGLKSSILNVESTSGQVLDINNKKYKAVLEDSFTVVERENKDNIYTIPLKLKDHILAFNGSSSFDVLTHDFKLLATIQAQNGAWHYTGMSAENFTTVSEDSTHIYLLFNSTNSSFRFLDAINKSTWQRDTQTKYVPAANNSQSQMIVADPEKNKLYMFPHVAQNQFYTFLLSDAKTKTALVETNVSTIYNYGQSNGANPFVYYNGAYVPQNHDFLYVLATRNVSFARHILKVRKSDHVVVAMSQAVSWVSNGDVYAVTELSTNAVLFVNSNNKAILFNRDTMGVTEGFLPSGPTATYKKEGDDIVFYLALPSVGKYTIIKGKMLTYQESPKSYLATKTYSIDNWSASDIEITQTHLTISADGTFRLHGSLTGVLKLESVKKIIGYKEVIT